MEIQYLERHSIYWDDAQTLFPQDQGEKTFIVYRLLSSNDITKIILLRMGNVLVMILI